MDTPQIYYNLESQVFDALAHPVRLEIMDLLREGEACVCHIQAMLDQRQAYISQHLNVLRKAGLVSSRKDGQRVYYQICDPQLFEIIDNLHDVLKSLGMVVDQPSDSLPHSRPSCHCPQCSSLPSC
jgi:DNA-binding transcriptional ArsR family regulator